MSIKFIILGSGSSVGVPRIDGYFGNCDPKNKKNIRTRCSALIKSAKENILIDTSPDLRFQLLKNKISRIDRVLYSHLHADQTHGINDLRVFYLQNRFSTGHSAPVILGGVCTACVHPLAVLLSSYTSLLQHFNSQIGTYQINLSKRFLP